MVRDGGITRRKVREYRTLMLPKKNLNGNQRGQGEHFASTIIRPCDKPITKVRGGKGRWLWPKGCSQKLPNERQNAKRKIKGRKEAKRTRERELRTQEKTKKPRTGQIVYRELMAQSG